MNTIWLVKCRFEPYGDPDIANVFYACEFIAAETLPQACDIMLDAVVHLIGTYIVEVYNLPTAAASKNDVVESDMIFTQSLTLHPPDDEVVLLQDGSWASKELCLQLGFDLTEVSNLTEDEFVMKCRRHQ